MLTSTLTAALAATTALFVGSVTAVVPRLGGQNFPDPAVIRTGDGWRAFSTEVKIDGQRIHVPMAYTRDWDKWQFRGKKDAMPKLAPWVHKNHPKVWAPDVVALPNGKFILYYTASLASNGAIHCLGYATSNNVEGPYTDNSRDAWICPVKQGGAIDPAGFYDRKTGKRYVVYKVDGNAIGHGGECGNTVRPIVPTPILLQQVNVNNGFQKIGGPIQILTNGPQDGPYVEAPALNYMNGKYVLFYSPQCYTTPKYDVSYAISNSITGPFIRKGALFKTGGPLGFQAPGGLDVAVNGDHAVWHANYGKGRALFTGILTLKNDRVTATIQEPRRRR
ncbi:hypothetical protein Q7P37_007301 [Cladosporium fusiforme]